MGTGNLTSFSPNSPFRSSAGEPLPRLGVRGIAQVVFLGEDNGELDVRTSCDECEGRSGGGVDGMAARIVREGGLKMSIKSGNKKHRPVPSFPPDIFVFGIYGYALASYLYAKPSELHELCAIFVTESPARIPNASAHVQVA